MTSDADSFHTCPNSIEGGATERQPTDDSAKIGSTFSMQQSSHPVTARLGQYFRGLVVEGRLHDDQSTHGTGLNSSRFAELSLIGDQFPNNVQPEEVSVLVERVLPKSSDTEQWKIYREIHDVDSQSPGSDFPVLTEINPHDRSYNVVTVNGERYHMMTDGGFSLSDSNFGRTKFETVGATFVPLQEEQSLSQATDGAEEG